MESSRATVQSNMESSRTIVFEYGPAKNEDYYTTVLKQDSSKYLPKLLKNKKLLEKSVGMHYKHSTSLKKMNMKTMRMSGLMKQTTNSKYRHESTKKLFSPSNNDKKELKPSKQLKILIKKQ